MSFVLDARLAADSHPVGDLALSQLRLFDDARFPWLLLVPRIAGARELIDLDRDDRCTLLDEITAVGRAWETLLQPDKLNIAALGNLVPQLHVHLIARYAHDCAWPRPVWGQGTPIAYEAAARDALLARLRGALQAQLD
ncbi:MAG: HIT domain-containing protein [Dokdonella sp.]|uniref:HIT domain-containing protein n=1 Tax=Dokdonella sp. TaxID=2291710 RepID=UPI0025B870E0|nr:HIT family protein [Dokdonella sp.]MBX3700809.1 HIT domain-containing protein [Dokdonella sp.]